jgi:hypothetical protein
MALLLTPEIRSGNQTTEFVRLHHRHFASDSADLVGLLIGHGIRPVASYYLVRSGRLVFGFDHSPQLAEALRRWGIGDLPVPPTFDIDRRQVVDEAMRVRRQIEGGL